MSQVTLRLAVLMIFVVIIAGGVCFTKYISDIATVHMAACNPEASQWSILCRLEAICSQLVNEQLRLSFAEHERNDGESNLPANTDIRRFIRSHWNA
ncbi:MAG: hypothetical protein WCC26_04550 [Terracidiphilus sp.]